jgi:hypothetical protein
VIGMPTSGHGTTGTAGADETGVLDLAGFSLEDLTRLDDSVVGSVIQDLMQRRRCGTEDGERFSSNWTSSI